MCRCIMSLSKITYQMCGVVLLGAGMGEEVLALNKIWKRREGRQDRGGRSGEVGSLCKLKQSNNNPYKTI